MLENLEDFLKKKDVKYQKDYEISKICPMGVGGKASIILYPDSTDMLSWLVDFLDARGTCYRVVGRFTNILAKDEGYDGAIISTVAIKRAFHQDCLLFAECGVATSYAVGLMAEAGFGGAEGLASVPGTLGGALCGNAGAFGAEISDIFVKGRFFSPDTGVIELSNGDIGFGYRSTALEERGLIFLDGIFRFQKSEKSSIMKRIRGLKEIRMNTQPTDKRSLGSIFKRVNGVGAGYYIDKAGLKGASVGGAEVSNKHAGFIINQGGATYGDIIELITTVKQKVYSELGVSLCEEIKYL